MPSSSWTPNQAQARAIEHGTGPLRIQAGAGSGKTTTLGYRINSLVQRGLCRADQILVLTFTNKAVEGMRRKLDELFSTAGERSRVETYHAFALSLVQEFAEHLGLPAEPAALTAGGPRLLVRQEIDRFDLQQQDLTRLDDVAKGLTGFMEWHRHEGTFRQDPDWLLDRLGPEDDRAYWAEMLRAFSIYGELLRERGAVDYGNQIAGAVQLLTEHPEVLAEIRARYPFLLVDEYQDTDFLQGELVRLLAGENGNVTIVGDPDQTIYSFRGAAMTNIRQFHERFPALTDVTMATNYRSSPEIIATANAAIGQNQRRKAEFLQAARASGLRPQLVEAPDWPSEAACLVRQIQELKAEGFAYAGMAILVRKNRHLADLSGALIEASIPVQVVGGIDLFADPEAVRCIGYLRALADPADDQAVSIALSMPRYGLTAHDLAMLARQRQGGESLVQTAGRLAETDARLKSFQAEFWPLYNQQFTSGCQTAVRAAIELHRAGLGPETRAGLEQLLDLAEEFFAHPDLFGGGESTSDLALFIQYLTDLRDVGEPFAGVSFDDSQEAVKLMTVHVAKGLEFPAVFLPRLTASDFGLKGAKWDRPFPLAWHHDPEFVANAAEMLNEEERRLFYVAVTRAMERLYLSWAPNDPARVRPVKRSPFLDEVEATCELLTVPASDGTEAAPWDLTAALEPLLSTAPAKVSRHSAVAYSPEISLPEVLSFTHLQTYQLCPFRFYLQYLLHQPGRPNKAADEGVRVHAAIEKLALAGGSLDFESFEALAKSATMEPERAELEPERQEAVGTGTVDPLRAFWESEYAQTPPVAAEQEFYLRLGPAVLRGFIDWLHPLPDGGVEVVDFKTYSRLQSAAEVKAGLQLPLYLLACREALGYPTASQGALFFLKHGTAVRVRYADEELQEARRRAEELVGAIRGRDWGPTPNRAVCGHCPYRDGCPAAEH